jgi:hypothetical protein
MRSVQGAATASPVSGTNRGLGGSVAPPTSQAVTRTAASMAQSSRHGMPGSTLFSSYLTAIRSFVQCLDTSLLHTPGNRRGRGGVEQRLAAPHHDAVAEDRARLPRHRGARTRPPAVRARIPRGTRGPRRRVPSEEEIRAHRAKDVHVSLPGPGYAEIRAPRSRLRMARPHGRAFAM